MAKATQSGVEGWQAFVGVAPFLFGAFRWLSLSRCVGFGFFLLVVGGWLVLFRVGIGPIFLVWELALPSWGSGWPCLHWVWRLAFLRFVFGLCLSWLGLAFLAVVRGSPFLLEVEGGGCPFLLGVVLLRVGIGLVFLVWELALPSRGGELALLSRVLGWPLPVFLTVLAASSSLLWGFALPFWSGG